MPAIQFSHPWYLLLLPLLVVGAAYVARRSLAGLPEGRAKWSLGLRVGIVALAVLALAGLQMSLPTQKLAVLFLLDQSDSIPPEQKRLALDFVNQASRRMGPRDEAGVLVFGTDAYVEMEARPALSLKQIHSLPARDYSNLAGAVRLALAAFPDDAQRRVVLLSDGNENLGSALQEAEAARGAGVQVDVVPITYRYEREVLLEKMTLPGEAKVGEPFEIRVVARSTVPTGATLRLLRNGALIAQQRVDLLEGPNVITFQQSLEEARFHTYEAVLEATGDQLAENNRALGFVLVRGKPRVLIVDEDPNDARFLAGALQGQQLQVDVRAPGQLPATLAEFQSYDSVVLSNVPAYQLTPDQMKAIRSSVRDLGTGLVMVGGEHSFGPGAYRGTPIEEALPVDMEVRKQKVMPVGAVAMILHTCEFPDGNRWAADTAAAVVDVLGARDKVGVLLYGAGEEWGVRMQPAANKPRLKSEIYNLNPGDAPDFQPLMQMAYQGLTTDAREAAVKHMIIISDGDPSPPTAALLASISRAKITVSTVAVFPHGGGTGTLETVAKAGKGRFYNVRRPEEIPRIFLKEAQRVLKPAIIEERFTPQALPGTQILQGITAVPPLFGYVATTPKQAASVEVPLVSKREDPILASWRYGLGKSVAFMSDAKNRWAAAWVADPATFQRFWAQTIRWTVRTTSRADLDAQVEIQQRRGKVVVDVVDSQGNFVNMLDLRGSVAGQSVSPTLRMDQTAPGRYEGEFEAPEKGQYMVGLQYMDRDVPRIHTIGAAVPYSPEYRNISANTAILTGLAEKTRGRAYPALNAKPHPEEFRQLWRHDRQVHSTPQDLWPVLLLTAALLLPVDIGARRLIVSRSEMATLLATAYDATLGRFSGAGQRAGRDEGMGRLLRARRRATGQADAEEAVAAPAPAPGTAAVPAARTPYQGPERRLPTVPGAGGINPPPATGRAAGPVPEMELAAAPGNAGILPASAARAEPPAAPPKASSEVPTPAPAPPRSTVVWNRPVPGVNPEASPGTVAAPAARPPAEKPPAAEPAADDADSAGRLLRAKRRARDRQSRDE